MDINVIILRIAHLWGYQPPKATSKIYNNLLVLQNEHTEICILQERP